MPSPLEESLFRTLAYFAYFQYPLTTMELWKWCDAPETSIAAIEECLVLSEWLRENKMRSDEGFFGIGDVEQWRTERIHRVTDALRKSRRAEQFVRFASWLPWVKMIAVCNSLAFSFTNNESDIDVFIVTQRGRIWSTRLILTGALAFIRARPGERANDPLCLSFFATEDRLDLSSVKIGPEDPYLMFGLQRSRRCLTEMKLLQNFVQRTDGFGQACQELIVCCELHHIRFSHHQNYQIFLFLSERRNVCNVHDSQNHCEI